MTKEQITELTQTVQVSVSFWRCGNIAWVEELWEDTNAD